MAQRKFTLKQWRKIRERTLTEMGEAIGVHFTTIARWENNPKMIPLKYIEPIEQYLNIKWKDDVKVQ